MTRRIVEKWMVVSYSLLVDPWILPLNHATMEYLKVNNGAAERGKPQIPSAGEYI